MNKGKTVIWQEEATRSRATTYRLGAETYVKCITELITNSQVAYNSKKGFQKADEKFVIKIVADQRKRYFEVYDFATGLAKNTDELNERIGSYSRMHKDVHTVNTRSMFGRGLSDVLFRQTSKEAIILSNKNGVFFKLVCKWDRKTGIKNPELQPVFIVDPNAEQEVKEKLPVSGTYVKFSWSGKESKGFPSKTELISCLRRYYELKNLLTDSSFKVNLEYHGLDGKVTAESLKFFTCVKSEIGRPLHNILLPIKGYDIRIISAKMYRSEEPLNQQRHSEARTAGLYIEGEHGQIYDLTLFGLEDINPDVTQHLVGEVVLSDDAKRYFQDAYTERNEEVLTRAREGIKESHKFYKILKGALLDWIKEIITSESKAKIEPLEPDLYRESYLELNKIAGEFLDKYVVVEDTLSPSQPDTVVETIKFARSQYSVIEGKIHRISLLINPKKFSPGTKIEFLSPNPDFKITVRVDQIPEMQKEEKNISIYVELSCSVLESKGSIIAKSVTLDGQDVQARADLNCVEEPIEPPLHEFLEFKPSKVTAEPDHPGIAHLWMHSNMIVPGDTVRFQFIPAEGLEAEDEDDTIQFEADATPSNVTKKDFQIVVDESLPLKNGYREYQVKFNGKKEGLKGVLTANVKDKKDIRSANCEIEIRSKVKPGLLRGWTAEESSLPQYAYFRPTDGFVVFNLSSGLVKKVIGDSYEEARKRQRIYQEVAMYIATGIMDIFLEYILVKAAHENAAAIFDQDYLIKHSKGELPWDDAVSAILLKKHKIIMDNGKTIITKSVPDIREDVPPDDIRNLEISFNESTKLPIIWYKESANTEVKDFEKQIMIKGSKITVDSLETFVFQIKDLKLYIKAYRLQNGYTAICLFDVIGKQRWEKNLHHILSKMQIYGKPTEIPKGIKGDLLFSPVSLGKIRDGAPTIDNYITQENFSEIPDSPKKNAYEEIVEVVPSWIENGKPLIHYEGYEEIVTVNQDHAIRGKMVCLIERGRTDIMALNFVRTKIVPLIR